ncbi:hypothetical protein WR25_00493 [Diploscapter pachys]|uniref:MAM domain-containing protein n=1 Tax=Diploscapter pachys TaxID=2018661 RepID=A0A2A2KXR0_9BILA|nr:hypothetical protein WR25_00493 [Diploscapter pachys]
MAETPNHGVMNFAYSRYGNAKVQIIISLNNIRNGFDIFALDDITFSLPKNSDEILTADDAFFKPDPISPDPVIHPAINREIRRSPSGNQNAQNGISDPSTNECVAIKCHFEGSACAWTFTNYRLVSGKMVSESEGESLLISEPVLIPKNSQFIIDIFARYSALPTTILIRSTNPKGAFTALTSSDIVDMNGKSLECGPNVPPIRPQRLDEYIRLTALQKLDPNDVRIGASLNEPPRFGFDKMNLVDAEKRGRALLETINAGRQGIEGIQGLIQKSSTISSALPSGRSINEALTNKILQTMPSPIDYGRDSKPFANQHLDYIVQNAYNRYQNQVQPG